MIKVIIPLVICLLLMPAIAKDVPVGKCTLAMNIGGLSLTVTPYDSDLENKFSLDYTVLTDRSGNISMISLVKYIDPQAINTLENSLVSFMNDRGFLRVSGDCWQTGYIAEGLAKGGERKCWGVAFPLDLDNSTVQFTRGLMVIADFKDKDLNERLVKSVKTENLKCSD
jgi:hypothetical protein